VFTASKILEIRLRELQVRLPKDMENDPEKPPEIK
jgi:hypothetical protein